MPLSTYPGVTPLESRTAAISIGTARATPSSPIFCAIMLSLLALTSGLIANGVKPAAPASRVAPLSMKVSGQKLVVPSK